MDRHVMKKKKFYLYKKGVVLCLITIIQRKCDKSVMKKQENDEQMEKKFAIVKNGAKMEEKAKDTMGGGRMQYEGQICRAPMERGSYMLPVAVGCSYNACKFCTLFKHLQYRELPIAQIEEELQRVKGLNGRPRRVFLGDGNAFGMKTERLLKILKLVREYFPDVTEVNMDATVTNIQEKSDVELKKLWEAGVRHLYLGIESGLPDVLEWMHKDHTLEEAYTAIDRIKRAGMIYDAHIMTGVAGRGRGTENAEKTAEFLNVTRPRHVINFQCFCIRRHRYTVTSSREIFLPADELENLMEEKCLLEHLQVDGLKYDGFHDFGQFRVRGTFPEDREKMLRKVEEAIEKNKKKAGFCSDLGDFSEKLCYTDITSEALQKEFYLWRM